MKKKVLKIIAITLVLSMCMMIFSSCKKKETSDTKSQSTSQKKNTATVENDNGEFTYPMKGNKKLTYWVTLNGNVAQKASNLANTPLGKEYVNKTGVEMEYIHPVSGQEKEQFNLLIASGEYPDIVEYNVLNSYTGGPEKAISDGFIIDLTEYLPKYAPNLMKIYKEHPEIEKMAKTDTGKYYSLPFIRDADSTMVYYGPIVRKDWLDDLGMDEPETIEDWYNMLTAFKKEKGASAPLSYQKWMLGSGNTFFGAYGIAKDFYLDEDGNVQFGSMQPGYYEFLKEFSKWYKEGLIDPDIETVDGKQVAAKITNGDTGASLGYQASRLGEWLKIMQDDPTYDLVGVKYPVLNRGDKPMFSQKDFSLPGTAAYITTACKDIEAALRAIDYAYSEEGHMLFNFGIEGESYDIVDGYPTYKEEMINNSKIPASVQLGMYTRACYSGPFVQDERYFEQYAFTFEQQKTANENWQYSDVEKYRMPNITPTPEESQELATIMSEVNTYRDEMYVRFLFGEESLDNFDTYVQNIKNMGIDRAIEIKTAALERYNNR